MYRNFRLKLLWLSAGMVVAVGCSTTDEGVSGMVDPSGRGDNDDKDDEGDEGRSGSGGNGGSGSAMDAGSPDMHEVITIDKPDATCAATSAEAPKVVVEKEVVTEVVTEEIKPVAIYLMLDRSSSMVGVCGGGGQACNPQSWAQATGAITAFLNDPASADLKVGLGYFPPKVSYMDKSPTSPLCTGMSCGTATVPVRRATDNAPLIAESLNNSVPPSDAFAALYTPTECGLRGIKSFCAAHRAANNNEKCVGVLITDGSPTECNTGTPALRQIAADMPDIQVFALGMTGANFTFLNEIAAGGGTDCTPGDAASAACDVSSGQTAFLAALKAIRDIVVTKETMVTKQTETMEVPLDCEWKLPDPPDDMKFDKEKVNVTFSADGKSPMELGRVPSEDECKKHPEGWRYDNEDMPEKVLACSGACDMIKSSTGAKITIAFGCKGRTLQ